MSFSIGIVGFPNVGKSTLFSALTQKSVDIGEYPFTTVHPNIGIVAVPDRRLQKIAEIVSAEKITPTVIKFVDIAGLVKGAHRGEGLGNQFLAHIRECDAILEVVRCFSISENQQDNSQNQDSQEIQYHLSQPPRPKTDIEIIKTEMIMKDLETCQKSLNKLKKKTQDKEISKKVQILEKIEKTLSEGKKISELNLNTEGDSLIEEYQFLTQKPTLYVFNKKAEEKSENLEINEIKSEFSSTISLDLKIEKEISELSEQDKKELKLKSHLDSLIVTCYNILDLITFYTIVGLKEAKAWTLVQGESCKKAAGIVHSDFEEKFIKAEVIFWKKLIKAGEWQKAKRNGWIRTEGKDYIIQDGDVIEFKI